MRWFAFVLVLMMILVAGCAQNEVTSGKTGKMDLPAIPPLEEDGGAPVSGIPDAAPEQVPDVEEQDAAPEVSTDHTKYQQKPAIQSITPSSFKLDVPKLHFDCYTSPCLDEIGAYAMAMRYFDKGIDIISVVGYGNAGGDAKMHSNTDLDNNAGETVMISATKRYGHTFVVGAGVDGIISRDKYDLKFEDHATKVLRFNNKQHALENMKGELSSRHPVVVYLDVSYLRLDFKEKSPRFWMYYPESNLGRFMTVVGYDADYIYLNDPNDALGEALPAPVDKFLVAWEATKFLDDRDLGPFWMISFNKTSQRRMEGEDVIDAINPLNKKAVDELKKAAASLVMTDKDVCLDLTALAKTRELYSDFLKRYEKSLAGTMYRDSSGLIKYACDDGLRSNLEKASVKESNGQRSI